MLPEDPVNREMINGRAVVSREYCGRVAEALLSRHELPEQSVGSFRFFAASPPGFTEQAESVIASALAAGENPQNANSVPVLRAARQDGRLGSFPLPVLPGMPEPELEACGRGALLRDVRAHIAYERRAIFPCAPTGRIAGRGLQDGTGGVPGRANLTDGLSPFETVDPSAYSPADWLALLTKWESIRRSCTRMESGSPLITSLLSRGLSKSGGRRNTFGTTSV
jgi:hypothetical protein